MKTETEWAIRNLELAGFFDKDSDYAGGIGDAVKELLEVLSKQGHSGASHFQTLRVFNHVASGKSLTLQHWQERFEAFNEFCKENGGGAVTEANYIALGYPKPEARP
jgi:hypothetical protein